MKALVLSCSTGQGHNAAAAALTEEFVSRGIWCQHDDVMTFAETQNLSEKVKDAYDDIVLNHPRTFSRLFSIGELISSPRHRSPVYFANSKYADSLGSYIRRENIDTVVCTHMFPAQALTALRMGGLDVRSYVVTTDYLCLPFWEECAMDRFIIAHESLVTEFVHHGIPAEKVVPIGLPVQQAFRVQRTKAEAREQLGLATDPTTYLVLTGSMGFGRIDNLPELLLDGDETAHVVVVAGRNQELKARLDALYGESPRFRSVGFTDEIAVYMDAADVVLSKPGGLTSTEVAAKRIPLVHTPAIPGFEMRNAVFFSNRGMSLSAADYEEAAGDAVWLAHHVDERKRMHDAQQANIDPDAVHRICDYILEDAETPQAIIRIGDTHRRGIRKRTPSHPVEVGA